jgi:hypothetical protein
MPRTRPIRPPDENPRPATRAPSENEDAASRGLSALAKRSQGVAPANGELRREHLGSKPKDMPVVTRIRYDKQDSVDARVPTFQRDPSLERLNVANPRLRLDRHRPSLTDHDLIPCPSIARNTERDLGWVAQPRGEAKVEPAEQG